MSHQNKFIPRWHAYFAELLGTFVLVLGGGFSVIQANLKNDDFTGVAITHGLIIAAMVYSFGRFSGGHFNPAVTLGFVIVRDLEWLQGLIYFIFQILGSFLAGAALLIMIPGHVLKTISTQSKLGFPALSDDITPLQGMLMEAVATFILVVVIFATARDKRAPDQVFGAMIGATVALDIFAIGPFTGAAMNPARVFGPAVLTATFQNDWVYWVGPFLGGALGAVTYWYGFFKGGKGDAKVEEEQKTPLVYRVSEGSPFADQPESPSKSNSDYITMENAAN